MTVGQRIEKKRKEKNMTLDELAERVGYKSRSSIYKVEQGILDLPLSKVEKIAKVLNTTPAYLMGWESEAESKREVPDWVPDNIPGLIKPAAYAVPILGNICCGNGIFANENFDGYFYIDQSIKADFCLRAHGMSMIDAGIQDNDYVLLKKDFDIVDGRIYAVLKKETNEAYLRRLYKQEDKKHIALMPCNADYSPDFQLADDVFIIGECVGVYHEVKY